MKLSRICINDRINARAPFVSFWGAALARER